MTKIEIVRAIVLCSFALTALVAILQSALWPVAFGLAVLYTIFTYIIWENE